LQSAETCTNFVLLQAMTSNAQLIAFDDEENAAILKFKNGKLFACPSDYVTVPFNEKVLKCN